MNKDFYIGLIYKRLKGELSEEEGVQLVNWLVKDAENQALADDLALVYREKGDVLDENVNNIEEQLEQAVEEAKVNTKNKKSSKSWFKRLQRKHLIGVILLAISLVVMGVWWNDLRRGGTLVTVETAEGAQEIKLSDGSKVLLEEGSEMEYVSNASGNGRGVTFLRGKGLFSIVEHKDDFLIRSHEGTITTQGQATFIVKFLENGVELTVTEGAIHIQSPSESHNESLELDIFEGESARVNGSDFVKNEIKSGL